MKELLTLLVSLNHTSTTEITWDFYSVRASNPKALGWETALKKDFQVSLAAKVVTPCQLLFTWLSALIRILILSFGTRAVGLKPRHIVESPGANEILDLSSPQPDK